MSLPKRSTIIPWEPCVFEPPIAKELDRRKSSRSFNYVEASQGGWDSENVGTGEWRDYKGPMSPWVRFCSNSVGPEFQTDPDGKYIMKEGKRLPLENGGKKPGFVLFGGKEFYTGYGFKPSGLEAGNSIIGYLPDGITTHTIDNDINSNYPIHVPPPEIERITVKIQKELYRQATVEWVCFSKKQLEHMTPYFLIPGISCVLEWGWNHFDSTCLLDLSNMPKLKELNNNPYLLYTDHILKSNGNYDVLMGRVTNFGWTVDGNKIKCTTEITSQDRIYSGLMTDSVSVFKDTKTAKAKEQADLKIFNNLKNFINENITDFKSIPTDEDPAENKAVGSIVKYIKKVYGTGPDSKWKEYVYGVFYGRDREESFQNNVVKLITDSKIPGAGYVATVLDSIAYAAGNEHDFDYRNDYKKIWLNMGLVIEIINYFTQNATTFNNEPMFRIDIDNVIITAHPNLISCDSNVLLIPNAAAPRYFWGKYALKTFDYDFVIHRKVDIKNIDYGVTTDYDRTVIARYISEKKKKQSATEDPAEKDRLETEYREKWIAYLKMKEKVTERQIAADVKGDDFNLKEDGIDLKISSIKPIKVGSFEDATSTNSSDKTSLADYKINRVCGQGDLAYRDNLDELINENRKKFESRRPFAFPFETVTAREDNSTGAPAEEIFKYPSKRTGYLKDLYINVNFIKTTIGNSENYVEFINNLLKGISVAAGEFWDFKLDSGSGDGKQKKGKPASLKIVDTKLMVTENKGTIYSFDYFDADSLLLGTSFKPMLTTSQAIRSIYAPVNRDDKNISITSGTNELLDYKFRDRLEEDDTTKNQDSIPIMDSDTSFKQMMERVQTVRPESSPDDPKLVCQMTVGEGEKQIIRRLAISPSRSQILKLLLDDGDDDFNPKYTGIMPGIEASFTIQGIGGLRTFMMFLVKNFPEPYSEKNIVFRITNVQETIESGKWTTVITAGIIPLRKHIKKAFTF